MHAYYNRENFPVVVWDRPGSPWLICASARGSCAAIPRDEETGHKASGFGDMAFVDGMKRETARAYQDRCAKPVYMIEHKARLAGEAAFLAGDACDLSECEARCADALEMAERYPKRGYQIFAYFVEGFNGMAETIAAFDFDRNGRDLRAAA
jgi:hypothetical protein